MNYKTEALSSQHNRKTFDCGVPSLTRYFQQQASQDQKKKVAACFVFRESEEVLGYYTLSSASVGLEKLPRELQKKLPRYPRIPATLMGRLAIDSSARGRRLGETLLFDAMFRALDASETVASFAFLVDALDVEPDPPPTAPLSNVAAKSRILIPQKAAPLDLAACTPPRSQVLKL